VTLHSKYTRALIFQNFRELLQGGGKAGKPVGAACAGGMGAGRRPATGSGRGEAGRVKQWDVEGDERVCILNADTLRMHTQEKESARERERARARARMLSKGSNGGGGGVGTGGEGAASVERAGESSQKSLL
jgi:hypothetical protein